MLDRLQLHGFTVFKNAEFRFCPGINLFAGENGSGKTHVLKAGYSLLHVLTVPKGIDGSKTQSVNSLEVRFASKLAAVFVAEPCDLIAQSSISNKLVFTAKIEGCDSVAIEIMSTGMVSATPNLAEVATRESLPIFLPTRELLTLAPFFVALFDKYQIPIEATYRDTCSLLGLPLVRESYDTRIASMLNPLEQAMGGRLVRNRSGMFCLENEFGVREIHVIAEGWRKLAMVAHLIATGQLTRGTSLFWDEPEANLNPKLIKLIATTILHLCQSGIQVFLATHSLFLMRELDILTKYKEFTNVPTRYFGLHPGEDGVEVMQGDSIDDIGKITSLQEELSQSDRYLVAEDDDASTL
jgi:energy-coupling factor transporter ATP-binding protein EcfA2